MCWEDDGHCHEYRRDPHIVNGRAGVAAAGVHPDHQDDAGTEPRIKAEVRLYQYSSFEAFSSILRMANNRMLSLPGYKYVPIREDWF